MLPSSYHILKELHSLSEEGTAVYVLLKLEQELNAHQILHLGKLRAHHIRAFKKRVNVGFIIIWRSCCVFWRDHNKAVCYLSLKEGVKTARITNICNVNLLRQQNYSLQPYLLKIASILVIAFQGIEGFELKLETLISDFIQLNILYQR